MKRAKVPGTDKLLGVTTLIYQPGDLSQYETAPQLTVGGVIDEIYCLRNHIAHRDKVPQFLFPDPRQTGLERHDQ
jgi:hypothetical protein